MTCRVALACGLLVLVVVVGTPASAAPATPSAACSAVSGDVPDDQRRVIGLPAVGDEPLTGTVSLYAGSHVGVVLCNGDGTVVPTGDGQIWRLSNGTGFEQQAVRQNAWVVSLTGGSATVDLTERVTGRSVDGGLRIRVRQGVAVNSTLVSGTVSFPNQSVAERYRRAERRFVDAAARINASATELNAASESLARGSLSAEDAASATESLTELRSAREQALESGETVRSMLYVAAVHGHLTPSQSAALTTVQKRQAKALAQSQSAIKRYHREVADYNQRTRSSISFVVGLSGGFGLLVGLVVGFTMVNRSLRSTVKSRRISDDAASLPRRLLRPGALALIFLGIGLALAYRIGLLEVVV